MSIFTFCHTLVPKDQGPLIENGKSKMWFAGLKGSTPSQRLFNISTIKAIIPGFQPFPH